MKKDPKKFWGCYAKFYDAEVLRFSKAAYQEMYQRMASVLTKEMAVLEIATGTGLIALHVAPFVKSMTAIDFSPPMIERAKQKKVPANVHFFVDDATRLSFAANTFDAVIISNALHIIPEPATVLAEIKRVLKPSGLFIAPNFTHGHLNGVTWNLSHVILKQIGFEAYTKWLPAEYVEYLTHHGFLVHHWTVLQAAFPLVYLEGSVLSLQP